MFLPLGPGEPIAALRRVHAGFIACHKGLPGERPGECAACGWLRLLGTKTYRGLRRWPAAPLPTDQASAGERQ
jgi:hypothetical protein